MYRFIYSFISLFINGYLVIVLTTKESNIAKCFVSLSIVCCISICLKTYIRNDLLSFAFDTVGLFLVCLLIKKRVSIFKEYILVFILNIFYQILSLFIRQLGYSIAGYTLPCSILFNIDYYLMATITYLYIKKGEETICSIFLRFGSFLRTKLWKKHSQSSNPCSDKG